MKLLPSQIGVPMLVLVLVFASVTRDLDSKKRTEVETNP